ncbi:hypothetical protein GCM10023205_10470 [Yinghuangia aomiensis]|uniref:DUF397 domain-containing protein n=1 Tax=Yinghuangia aomiensis TaxID=676205 RepID=A0ABP9GTW4_9ACTN
MNKRITGYRKSSYSGGGSNECVAVGTGEGVTGVRDTKDRRRGHIAVPDRSWAAFLETLKG